jgi:hypothetical protein
MPACIGGLSNSQGRPMTTATTCENFDRINARAQFIRHRDAADGGQFLVSDHSDAWRDVCPFTFVELEDSLVAGGEHRPSTTASDTSTADSDRRV